MVVALVLQCELIQYAGKFIQNKFQTTLQMRSAKINTSSIKKLWNHVYSIYENIKNIINVLKQLFKSRIIFRVLISSLLYNNFYFLRNFHRIIFRHIHKIITFIRSRTVFKLNKQINLKYLVTMYSCLHFGITERVADILIDIKFITLLRKHKFRYRKVMATNLLSQS